MAFDGYRYMRLLDNSQLAHHAAKRAFAWLLELAGNPTSFEVRVAARPVEVAGAILVWGATSPAACADVISKCQFAAVLSLEHMLQDLHSWSDPGWQSRVAELRAWSDGVWDMLGGRRDEEALS